MNTGCPKKACYQATFCAEAQVSIFIPFIYRNFLVPVTQPLTQLKYTTSHFFSVSFKMMAKRSRKVIFHRLK